MHFKNITILFAKWFSGNSQSTSLWLSANSLNCVLGPGDLGPRRKRRQAKRCLEKHAHTASPRKFDVESSALVFFPTGLLPTRFAASAKTAWLTLTSMRYWKPKSMRWRSPLLPRSTDRLLRCARLRCVLVRDCVCVCAGEPIGPTAPVLWVLPTGYLLLLLLLYFRSQILLLSVRVHARA